MTIKKFILYRMIIGNILTVRAKNQSDLVFLPKKLRPFDKNTLKLKRHSFK